MYYSNHFRVYFLTDVALYTMEDIDKLLFREKTNHCHYEP